MYLPDTNLWLALAFRSHAHHETASEWFERTAEAACSFCRITQQGFLRLSTNPKAFGTEAVSLVKAWAMYDAFRNDPRVGYAEEPTGLERYWRSYTRRRSFSPNVWSDAYLAAFARTAGLELATFDKGLAQYKGVRCVVLS